MHWNSLREARYSIFHRLKKCSIKGSYYEASLELSGELAQTKFFSPHTLNSNSIPCFPVIVGIHCHGLFEKESF
jgi:hypothetical protein